jgi:hypothetical protein
MAPGERPGRDPSKLLSFVDCADDDGFAVVDNVERRRCEVRTSNPVDPEELQASEFDIPVDRVVSVTTGSLSISHTVAYVRDQDGKPIVEMTNGDDRSFPKRRYQIELTTPIKLYIVVEARFGMMVTDGGLTIDFEGQAEVVLGARAQHDRPAATVTTTEDPEDLMRAVSSLGSALKTTSCERAYPTLRGHPPAIEYGDELCVPGVLDIPETGIRIEVPPEYGPIYAVSSLAYYLGATVVPGERPLIATETGFVHGLDDTDRGFEREVERVLKQCLFLDCITRTEGRYPVDLHEREQIEDAVALDFSRLYGRPLAEQFEAYLGVPYPVIEPHVPRWRLTAHVEPAAESAEALPYVVRELAAIRPKEPPEPAETADGTADGTAASLGIDEFVRSQGSTQADLQCRIDRVDEPVVRIDGTDAFEDMWIGNGIPVGASKGMVEAFRNHTTRTPLDDDMDIDITVVVNDPGMTDESSDVNEVYGSRDALPFDVTVVEQLTTGELAETFRREIDFLHYIGHIDEGGFECSDGMLDAATLEKTGVDAFFLNACDSYRQGKHLVEAGAIAGVATLAPIPNDEAEKMGKRLARLLNRGFPLYAALDVANVGQEYSNYIVIGNSGFNIVQSNRGAVSICEIEDHNQSEKYSMSYITYLFGRRLVGSSTVVFVGNDRYSLRSGKLGNFTLDKSEFFDLVSHGRLPVIYEDEIYWCREDLQE